MPNLLQEHRRQWESIQQRRNQETRGQVIDVLNSLGIISPNENAVEKTGIINRFGFANGKFKGQTYEVQRSFFTGISAGTVFEGLTAPLCYALFLGCHFISTEGYGEHLIRIRDGCSATFVACTFQKVDVHPLTEQEFVHIEGMGPAPLNDGTAIFLGCNFYGPHATGNIVVNAGLAANCRVVGCRRDCCAGWGGATVSDSF